MVNQSCTSNADRHLQHEFHIRQQSLLGTHSISKADPSVGFCPNSGRSGPCANYWQSCAGKLFLEPVDS